MAVRESYTKMYKRINWQNGSESKSTALDKINLNKMDAAIDEADTRIAALDTAKAEESEVLQMVKDISFNQASYLLTVKKKNGAESRIDLGSTYIAEIRRQVQAASSSASAAALSAGTAGQYKTDAAGYASSAAGYASAAAVAKETAGQHALNARSWSDGDTGTREGEATDCAKYYSERSKNSSDISKLYLTKTEQAADAAVSRINEAVHGNIPTFTMDFNTGHMMYTGGQYIFKYDDAGHMRWRIAL